MLELTTDTVSVFFVKLLFGYFPIYKQNTINNIINVLTINNNFFLIVIHFLFINIFYLYSSNVSNVNPSFLLKHSALPVSVVIIIGLFIMLSSFLT